MLIGFGLSVGAGSAADAAQPGYYRVAGVAAGDVLNIRSEPNASGDIVGELKPDAGPIEVLDVLEVATAGGGEWGRVLASDANGWVAMRFLEPVPVEPIAGTEIPDGLWCGGTEPFWSATLSRNGMSMEKPDGPALETGIDAGVTAIGRMHRFALTGSGAGVSFTAMLGRFEQCSDGMSDRDYGWRIDLLLEKPGDGEYPQLFEGCCMLPLPN